MHKWSDWKAMFSTPPVIVNYRRILLSERMLHKYYESKYSVGKKMLGVSLKGLVAKTT
jgi:hypothetical protein